MRPRAGACRVRPHLGHEVLPAPFGNVGAGGAVTLTGPEAIGLHDRNGNGAEAAATAEPMAWPEAEHMAWPEPEPMAWPTSDLTHDASAADGPETFQEVIDAAARLEAVAGAAGLEPAVESEPAVDEVAADVDEVAAEVAPLEAAIEAEPEHLEPIAPAVEVAPPAPAPPVETAPPDAAGDQLDDLAAAAAANTSDLLNRFRPGDDIDEQIAAYEREKSAAASAAMAAAAEAAAAEADAAEAAASRAAAEAAAAEAADVEARAAAQAAEAEARAAADAEARAAAVAAEQAMRAAAEAEARAAAQAAEAEARATAEAQARAAAQAAAQAAAAEAAAQAAAAEPRDDVVYQPTWQIVAPEPPAADQPLAPQQSPFPPGPSAAEPIAASAEPEWPSQPEWPRPPSAAGLPFLGRPPAASGGIEALWAESAREVDEHRSRRRRQAGRWRAAVCQLRAVTLRERPVLPALRHPAGLTPQPPCRRRHGHAPRPLPGAGSGTRTTTRPAR